MIKINLLKSFGTNSSEVLQQIQEQNSVQVTFIKKVLVMMIGVLVLFLFEQYNIPSLKKTKTELSTEHNELVIFNQQKEALKNEVEKYDKDRIRLNRQTDFLQMIQKERVVSVIFLEKIREFIPKSVWLTDLKFQGNEVEIRGEAESEREINEFNIKLSGVSFLKEVIVISIDLKPVIENLQMPIKSFSMKAKIVEKLDQSLLTGSVK